MRRSAVVVPALLLAGLTAAGCNSTTSTAASAPGTAPVVAPTASVPVVDRQPASAVGRAPAGRKAAALQPGGALAGGGMLPKRALTPGAVNPAVTQASIRMTICRTGYTKTIRPSSSYTTAVKRAQLAAGYAFHGDLRTSDYEEDHLISLELGGSPASVKNLWPEPYAASQGARVKDKIENRLHDLVCSGRIPLRTAQRAIAGNWWTAYQRYGGAGVPTVWAGAYATSGTTTPTSGSGATTTTSSSASAQCRDGSYSYSHHRSGTCSHHGGIDHWINPPPS